jgi:hypothetical protein
MRLQSAALTPMPNARIITTAVENKGFFRSIRMLYRTSRMSSPLFIAYFRLPICRFQFIGALIRHGNRQSDIANRQ